MKFCRKHWQNHSKMKTKSINKSEWSWVLIPGLEPDDNTSTGTGTPPPTTQP